MSESSSPPTAVPSAAVPSIPVPPGFQWKSPLHIDPETVDGDERALSTRVQRIITDVKELSAEALRVRDQHRTQVDELRRALETSEERAGKMETMHKSGVRQSARHVDLLLSALKQIDDVVIDGTAAGALGARSRIENIIDEVFRDFGITRGGQ